MRTEKEKMVSGQLYAPSDRQLTVDRDRAHSQAQAFNSAETDQEREELIRKLFGSTGKNIRVEPTFRTDYGYNIHVGEGFYANFNCVFLDVCPITIGKNALLGPGVSLVTPEHPLDPEARHSGYEFGRPISIGDNCWIAANATIVGGVTLGDNVVVAAGAVVNKSFPNDVVIGGVPAKIIKKISTD